MIDKLWYDWQHRNKRNAKSFFGGSVQALETTESYKKYPNGAPPYLDVSFYSPQVLGRELSRYNVQLSSTMPADGLFPEAKIGDVMDTTSGILCYVYE